MKIACIAPSQIPSATAHSMQLMKVCDSLAELGHQVRVFVPGAAETAWPLIAERYGLKNEFQVTWVKSNQALRRYDFTWTSVGRADQWGADLIYTWLPQAAVLALTRGLPAVLELHDRPTGALGPFFTRRFIKMAGRKRLLVITNALQGAIEKDLGIKIEPGEIQIAPNGAEPERYAGLPQAPGARAQLGLTDKMTAVYTGHFYQGRGVELLIGLARHFPDVQFLWVGGTPESCNLIKDRLAADGIGNVVMTGFIDNRRLPLFQAAGEILLMPYERSIAGSSGGNSADICSPMKMFEYLACGRAILSSDLPVLHEVLNESNACFCEPENLDSWVEGFNKLTGDPSYRAMLADQALLTSARYTWGERSKRALKGLFA